MIFQHYRELVTEKAGKAWFAITSESTKAVPEQAGLREQIHGAELLSYPMTASRACQRALRTPVRMLDYRALGTGRRSAPMFATLLP